MLNPPRSALARVVRVEPTRHDSLSCVPQSSLDGARAAVLARLWSALAREPISGLRGRRTAGAQLIVTVPGGRDVRGPAWAATPFATVPAGLALTVDGVGIRDPASLLRTLALPYPAETLAGFAAELDNSVANLALARDAQPPPDGGASALVRAPARTRPAGVPGAVRRGRSPPAPVLPHPDGALPRRGARLRPGTPAGLFCCARSACPSIDGTVSRCPPVLPVHPWQLDHVLDQHPWLDTTRRGAARPAADVAAHAGPGRRAAHHVKTAVDVQMTSAVRTVSAAAIHNGPAVSAAVGQRALSVRPAVRSLPRWPPARSSSTASRCRSLAVVHRARRRSRPARWRCRWPRSPRPHRHDGRPIVTEVVQRGYGGDPLAFIEPSPASCCRRCSPC